jgi:regulator of protease activity HflC (stomatin/prohibitin superfamily)
LAEYKLAPAVTRTRLYLESMEKILSQAGTKIIVDPSVPNLIPMMNPSGITGKEVAAK